MEFANQNCIIIFFFSHFIKIAQFEDASQREEKTRSIAMSTGWWCWKVNRFNKIVAKLLKRWHDWIQKFDLLIFYCTPYPSRSIVQNVCVQSNRMAKMIRSHKMANVYHRSYRYLTTWLYNDLIQKWIIPYWYENISFVCAKQSGKHSAFF